MDSKLSFEEILDICPEIRELVEDIDDYLDAEEAASNKFWYHKIKPQIVKLVGFAAQDPRLKTCEV